MADAAQTNGGRKTGAPTRTRPWAWGYAVVGVLFVVSWIDTPSGPGRANTVGQFASIGMFTLPAVLIVGAMVAFVPQRMRRFRVVILAPIAFYLAAIGAPFTFRAPPSACDGTTSCAAAAATRMVGFAVQSAIWWTGWMVEAVAIRIRRPRL